jgi:hypothetical protein
MREFPEWVGDPLRPESRFTRLPALAIVPDSETESSVHSKERSDATREAVGRLVGLSVLDEDDVLGQPETLDGSSGHGADLWAVILLWSAAGVVGGAAWDVTKAAARRLRELVSEIGRGRQLYQQVSAGAARLLAIDYVLGLYADEGGPLDTEAIEEPSYLSAGGVAGLSYAADQPWIVVLVSASLTHRYIVVVMPDGSIAGAVRVPLTKIEQALGVAVEIPGGDDGEREAARERADVS